MIRRILKRIGIFCVFLVIVDIAVWQVADRVRLPEAAEGLTRHSLATETEWTVSYIRQAAADGDARRLIYVHGTPGDATSLQGYLVDPVEGFESISIDRPGFGHTTPMKVALTLAEQARAIKPFLVERGGEWPILLGHSMGGPIIAQVAGMYPEKVGGLVIVAGSLDPELEEWKWYNRLADMKLTGYMIPRALRHSNRELAPLKGELEKLKALLGEVRCPVVIVHAPDDMLVPFANVAYMEGEFAEGIVWEVVVLEGMNHFLPWNSEGAIRRAIEVVAGVGEDEKLEKAAMVLTAETR
jgi:pimeloyl-ACP methyl ester carboxylesterase